LGITPEGVGVGLADVCGGLAVVPGAGDEVDVIVVVELGAVVVVSLPHPENKVASNIIASKISNVYFTFPPSFLLLNS
jgi:hypothetical protein